MEIDYFSQPIAFGITTLLLFLIIFCLMAYHYLRAQVKYVSSEADSIYGLKAEKEKIEKEIEVLNDHLRTLKTSFSEPEIKRLIDDKISLEREYDLKFRELEDIKNQLNTLLLENDKSISQKNYLERDLDILKKDIEELKKEKEKIDIKVGTVADLTQTEETIKTELSDLEKEYEKVQNKFNEKMLELKEECEIKEKEKDQLHSDIKNKSLELDILIAREQNILAKVADADSDDEKSDKISTENNLFSPPTKFYEYDSKLDVDNNINEREYLDNFREELISIGCHFSDRIIRSFHTSLKCNDISPLTVLAGVSGTGKTLLPLKYAEFFGIPRLVVSVQPRWDSHDDLFGSYNFIEKRFVATELARSLVIMDKYNNKTKINAKDLKIDWSKHLFLVLLDEMNLARTEYYFSEFLSKLELRRNIDETLNNQREDAEILTGKDSKTRIWIGNNVLFVGTMNEDESTKTLSDKVLDRANILRFSSPNFKKKIKNDNENNIDLNKKTIESTNLLTLKAWEKWKSSNCEFKYSPNLNDKLLDISKIMDDLCRPFGHRLMDSIKSYICQYPIKGKEGYEMAFGDQIEQKLLPKLRGIQLTDNNLSSMNQFVNITEKIGDEQLATAIRKCLDNSDLGLFFWNGVNRDVL